jgi:hypothetical protein
MEMHDPYQSEKNAMYGDFATLGAARHQLVLQMRGAAVEGQALDPAMGSLKNQSAMR